MSNETINTSLSFAAQTGGLVVVIAEGTTVVAASPVVLAIAGALVLFGGYLYLTSDFAPKSDFFSKHND